MNISDDLVNKKMKLLRESSTELDVTKAISIINSFEYSDISDSLKTSSGTPTIAPTKLLIMILSISTFILACIFWGAPEIQNKNIPFGESNVEIEESTSIYADQERISVDTTSEYIAIDHIPLSREEINISFLENIENVRIVSKNVDNPTLDSPNYDFFVPEKNKGDETSRIQQNAGSDQRIRWETNKLEKFSDRQLKRLKKVLYKALQDDGLIKSKMDYVFINLHPHAIIINDFELNEALRLKYGRMTKRVGIGAARGVEISQGFIRVGDFTDAGFRGYGLGNFINAPDDIASPKPIKEPSSSITYLEDRIKIRDMKIEKILSLIDYNPQKIRMKGVELSYNKCKRLHSQLYALLIAQEVVDNPNDVVVINLEYSGIAANGIQLDLSYDYKMLAKFIDKSIDNRMIRMSESTFSIGDYNDYSFTGTSVLID